MKVSKNFLQYYLKHKIISSNICGDEASEGKGKDYIRQLKDFLARVCNVSEINQQNLENWGLSFSPISPKLQNSVD